MFPISDGHANEIDFAEFSGPSTPGYTYELIDGLIDDPKLSPAETARKEVLEECGYDVPIGNLEQITTYW